MALVWQIKDDSPNLPNFLPTKLSHFSLNIFCMCYIMWLVCQSYSDTMSSSFTMVTHFAQMKEAIRYLEFCVEKLGNQETAIHNFLLSLYAKQTDKTLLLKYLYKYSKVCPSVRLSVSVYTVLLHRLMQLYLMMLVMP